MAVRIDKDLALRYADKAFLAVAVAFLAVVAVTLLWPRNNAKVVRYEVVDKEYQAAVNKQNTLFNDPAKLEQDVRTLLGLPEGDLSKAPNVSKEDVEVYNLLVTSPPLAAQFAAAHVAQAQAWADRPQWDPYKPSVSGSGNIVTWSLPQMLIAPTDLVLIQDKGYRPGPKDTVSITGTDLLYIAGQARVNLGQQTRWSREAAPGATNIVATVPTDYEVERRQQAGDGTWGPWQAGATVRLEQMKGQPAAVRPKELEAKALEGLANRNARKTYADAVEKYRQAIIQRGRDLLHPLFYKMAGKDWMAPYNVRKVPEGEAAGGAGPAAGEGPAEGGAGPPATPPFGGVGPLAGAGSEQTDLWFTDALATSDVGKTFQYRVRIRFFNPIFNGEAIRTRAEERYRIDVAGAWSEPSEAITVAPLVRFYFTGMFSTGFGERANVELHAWKHGWWYRKKGATFDIGDPIVYSERQDVYLPGGDSGPVKMPYQERIVFDAAAMVVDLGEGTTRSAGAVRLTERLVFWNRLTNRLESRLAWDDRNRAGQDQKKEEAETGAARLPLPGLRRPPVPPPPAPRQPPVPSPTTAPMPAPAPAPGTPPALPPGVRRPPVPR